LLVASYAQREVARALANETPALRVRLMMDGTEEGYAPYESTLAAYPATRIDDETTGGDMLYSSGTTGRCKGVFASPRDPLIEAPTLVTELCRRLYGFDGEMRYLSPGPLYHAAPLRFSLSTQALGGTAVIMERFDAERYLELVPAHRITHTQLVPTMFSRMLKLPPLVRERYDISSLRVAIHAAAPCPMQIKQQMIDWWGPIIWEYYSGTEANGFTSADSAEWLKHKVRSDGPWWGNYESAIRPVRWCRRGNRVSSISPTVGPSATTTTRSRPRRHTIRNTRVGPRWAISDMSTRKAICS
jgi:long-chain acyl-CoA synthetase